MPYVAIVLGAGGVLGSAFHAGVLAALEDAGFDPRDADLVVGTSAGANTAVTLRAGLSGRDLYARLNGQPLSASGEALAQRIRTPLELEAPTGRGRPVGAPHLVLRGLLRRGPIRPIISLAGLLPRGQASTAPLAARAIEAHPDHWPDRSTWIVAVNARTGKRVVFGRDDAAIDHLSTAVAASSAVPGHFAPVSVDGHEHIDGGTHSATNADLAAGLGFDLVVVSAPMSITERTPGRRGLPPTGRSWHARVLDREAREIRERGSRALVVEPSPADLAMFGTNSMDGRRSGEVAEQARRATAAALAANAELKRLLSAF